ncbi:MAG: hypothetical protein R3E64_09550 [Halioglobus sp.]
MTESEFLEALNLHAANAITSSSVFLTYVFGFVTAAYFVGQKLSRNQTIIVSVLYVIACGFWLTSALTHADSFATLVAANQEYVPSRFWFLPWPLLAVVSGLVVVVASLYFMYDVRSKNGLSNT